MYYVTGATVSLYIDGINTVHISFIYILMALGFLLLFHHAPMVIFVFITQSLNFFY